MKTLRSIRLGNNKITDISPLRQIPNLPYTSVNFSGNPVESYVIKDQLYEEFLVSLLEPYVDKTIEKIYGELRQHYSADMLDIQKIDGGYRVKVQVETFVGAHNPPYGIDTITIVSDDLGTRVEGYKHEEK